MDEKGEKKYLGPAGMINNLHSLKEQQQHNSIQFHYDDFFSSVLCFYDVFSRSNL